MNSLNTIIVEGNVVQEPVMRETPKGTHVCTFSLMTIRSYKKDDSYEKEISFFEVETWAKLAELCMKNVSKGRGVRVVGRLKQSRWEGTDGKKRAKIGIIAEHVEFKPMFLQKDGDKGESVEKAAPSKIAESALISAEEALVF